MSRFKYKDENGNWIELAKKSDLSHYTAELGTTWVSQTGYVTQAVSIQGILATDKPIIDIVTTVEGFEDEQKEWAKVFKATTSANTITFYAKEATTAALNLNIEVVR